MTGAAIGVDWRHQEIRVAVATLDHRVLATKTVRRARCTSWKRRAQMTVDLTLPAASATSCCECPARGCGSGACLLPCGGLRATPEGLAITPVRSAG
jgi:hypothetical protein